MRGCFIKKGLVGQKGWSHFTTNKNHEQRRKKNRMSLNKGNFRGGEVKKVKENTKDFVQNVVQLEQGDFTEWFNEEVFFIEFTVFVLSRNTIGLD